MLRIVKLFGNFIVTIMLPKTMKQIYGLAVLGIIMTSPVRAEPGLIIAYPKGEQKTTANTIFLLGSAPPNSPVFINGIPVVNRSSQGHFAPSLPLQVGENIFTIKYENQETKIKVIRTSAEIPQPSGVAFVPGSLRPGVDVAKRPGDLVCFAAIAPQNANVAVVLGEVNIPLISSAEVINLPDNKAVLTNTNSPIKDSQEAGIGYYQGCAMATAAGELGEPKFQLTLNGETISQMGTGKITILSPTDFEIAEVKVVEGTTRTGPSTDYSRLTPLPKGTKAVIIGREGEWVKLDYGVWIKAAEVQIYQDKIPLKSIIRSVTSRQVGDWTEVYFPLENPVPMSIQQGDNTFTLTLYNTTAQTDTIKFDDDPLISRLDWQQNTPEQLQYIFNLKTGQQWGYKLRYEGTTLVLSLRHPPQKKSKEKSVDQPLNGMKILIDPGHGGPEDGGAIGPTGAREKDVALTVSKLLRNELIKRGATVVMTRETDVDLDLPPRVAMIQKEEPTLSISLHYNALPDYGNAEKTQGVGMFWYHPQAHSLAVFLHNYLVADLDRPSYGVFWNNLALTRPTVTPSILMELGFMINPKEFEWIMDEEAQVKLANSIAQGITEWFSLNTGN
jgi:N-acetylmuramoyl-L-alanine amidase